jgi:hypothetical protein
VMTPLCTKWRIASTVRNCATLDLCAARRIWCRRRCATRIVAPLSLINVIWLNVYRKKNCIQTHDMI